MHIWSLAQHLLARGHKVVVLTHAYGSRFGVRYMAGGLKVYYMPLRPLLAGTALPTFVAMYPLMRQIMLREGITVVHGHQVNCQILKRCLAECLLRHAHVLQ
jgi:phosphatidylinositol N-acetylglucosaminyltransferase subunit A